MTTTAVPAVPTAVLDALDNILAVATPRATCHHCGADAFTSIDHLAAHLVTVHGEFNDPDAEDGAWAVAWMRVNAAARLLGFDVDLIALAAEGGVI
jgi:hypothetical protein